MTYVKKLVMQGFKSFAKKTEIPFTPEINVILGPNGSGKSNISDALCFVLGRLSMKSIRAAKSRNLIFLGTKSVTPAKEASVEIIFDNSDKTFSLENNEISIKRIVKKSGQSVYKINNETKTRQEVLNLLAQGGIDPHGFNIILQGEIQNFVRMHTEERRKIVEEVSGISVYESRKEKSLRELEKTSEKLREINAILRERTIYLNNLERERQQALRFKKLEENAKRYKASIINFDLLRKRKENAIVNKEILKKETNLKKTKETIMKIKNAIRGIESKIGSINFTIQKSEGLEQEKLNEEIANLRAELAGINVKIENYESKISEILNQKEELQRIIKDNESSIKELHKETPILSGKQKDLEIKKKEVEDLEEQRKKFYIIKSELRAIKDKLKDKRENFQNYLNESRFILKQMQSISRDLFDRKTDKEKINSLKISVSENEELLGRLVKKERELEKKSYSYEQEIDKQNELIEKISHMEICPLCKSRITEDHINSIKEETGSRIIFLKNEIEASDKGLGEISRKKDILSQEIEQMNSEIFNRESDLVRLSTIEEKKEQIKLIQRKIEGTKKELFETEKREKELEEELNKNSGIEKRYETAKIELQEISLRTEENLDSEISFRKRELDRSKISLRELLRNQEDLSEEIEEIKSSAQKKRAFLKDKIKQEEELTKKFRKMISERESLQTKLRENQIELSSRQNILHNFEQEMNNLKIDKARFDAEVENLEIELREFGDIKPVMLAKEVLISKLNKTREILLKIGSVNLRSLEVYESVKKEYDTIKEKMGTIEKEKEEILKIIHSIDVRKKKTFIKTLNELNEIFSRNFSRLNSKGHVSLELENKTDPFEPGTGIRITVKTGHGKYFDATSLSGGEQVLIALALIFAIQELRPYQFYLLDEIDAALDKRNSERLSLLLRKYMERGQYIIITHNDEIILNANNLYGLSMHDGISKVVSLRI